MKQQDLPLAFKKLTEELSEPIGISLYTLHLVNKQIKEKMKEKVKELQIHNKDTGLDDINKKVIDDNIEPEPRSGRQEYLENILNKYL